MTVYWDDEQPTELELKQRKVRVQAAQLRELPASHFTVNELGLLLQCGWSSIRFNYHERECDEIQRIYDRSPLGVNIT